MSNRLPVCTPARIAVASATGLFALGPALAETFTTLTEPVVVPLKWVETKSSGSGGRKLGIYVSLGGSATPQLFEFDTGGAGFYAAYGTGSTSPWWGAAWTTTGQTFSQSYDSGMNYTGTAVTTSVQLFESATATTPLLTATNVIVGQAATITDSKPGHPPVLWPLPSDTSPPPVNTAFWGDFGMAPKEGLSGIDLLAAQLQYGPGVTPGYRVHATDDNPWVQFGLYPSDTAVTSTTFPLNMATGASPAGIAYCQTLVVMGTLSVTDGTRTFDAPTGFIFDTGASTSIHSGTPSTFPSDLTKDGDGTEVKHGATVLAQATAVTAGGGQAQTLLSLTAGPTTDTDKVAVQTQTGGSYYMNTGILPFLSNDFVYNLGGAQLSIVPPSTAKSPDLDGSGVVDQADVNIVLNNMGPCSGCPCDLDDSGDVNFGDAALVLLNFN